MTNPFEAHAARQMTGAQRAEVRRQERVSLRQAEKARPPSPLEKKMKETAELLKLYRKWRREVRAEVAAAHAREFAALMRLLRNLNWGNAPKVVDFVHDAWWLRNGDEDTKHITLDLIDASLCRARVRHGLPHADDGLPGEPTPPFIKIRRFIMGY